MASMLNPSSKPRVDDFASILSQEARWFDLGTLIGAPGYVLQSIQQTYTGHGPMRCLIELHKNLDQRNTLPTWRTIAEALRRMENDKLADTICPRLKEVKSEKVEAHIKQDISSSEIPGSHASNGVPLSASLGAANHSNRTDRQLPSSSSSQTEEVVDYASLNKHFIASLRSYHAQICTKFNTNTECWILFTGSLFGAEVIDSNCMLDFQRRKPLEGASDLLLQLSDYLKGADEGDFSRYKIVLNCFEEQESFKDLLKKMKEFKGPVL